MISSRIRIQALWLAVLSLGLLGQSVLLNVAPAYAQCSGPGNIERALRDATTVFVGKVTSTDDAGQTARMEVLSIWKGRTLPGAVEVRGNDPGGESITRTFDVGNTYLVIPENTRAPFLASGCSATQAWVGASSLIPNAYQDAVGASVGTEPAKAQSSAREAERALTLSILPLLGVIALIALTWGAISRLRSLQPERAVAFAEALDSDRNPAPKPAKAKTRNLRKDLLRTRRVARKKVRRHGRGLKKYRRRQERQVAAARKARGSTDTS